MRIVIINFFSMKRIVLLLFGIVLSLFLSVGELFAEDIGNNLVSNIGDDVENNLVNNSNDNIENNTSKEIELITKDTNIINEKSRPSLKDIFGDDQTFPFVAGFGKD